MSNQQLPAPLAIIYAHGQCNQEYAMRSEGYLDWTVTRKNVLPDGCVIQNREMTENVISPGYRRSAPDVCSTCTSL